MMHGSWNKAVLCLAIVPVLGGCVFGPAIQKSAELVDDAVEYVFPDEDLNMTQRNYAAADYMIHQSGDFITRDDLIKAIPLYDREAPAMSSSIGNLIPQEVGIRLTQLGYMVDLEAVLEDPETNYNRPALSPGARPDFFLDGSYRREEDYLKIGLRLSEVSTKRVVASFNFAYPMNRDVEQLSEPAPRVFRKIDEH